MLCDIWDVGHLARGRYATLGFSCACHSDRQPQFVGLAEPLYLRGIPGMYSTRQFPNESLCGRNTDKQCNLFGSEDDVIYGRDRVAVLKTVKVLDVY